MAPTQRLRQMHSARLAAGACTRWTAHLIQQKHTEARPLSRLTLQQGLIQA
jgi:hypothetical protein